MHKKHVRSLSKITGKREIVFYNITEHEAEKNYNTQHSIILLQINTIQHLQHNNLRL